MSNPEELATDVAEDTEQKNNANMEASVAPAPAAPAKVQKENSVRPRIRSKALKGAPESIPKAILKRKRSQNYWLWIVSCVLIVLAALVLAFIILS